MRASLAAAALGFVSAVFALPTTVDDCEDNVITDPQSSPSAYPQYYSQPSPSASPQDYSQVDPKHESPVYTVYYSTQQSYPSYPSVTPQSSPTEEPCDETSPQSSYPSVTPVSTYGTDTSPSYGNMDDFTKSYMELHNSLRAKHGAPPLKYSQTMANYATQHVQSGGCHMQHSHGPYGENLGIGFSKIDDCINAWYDEEKYYNYANGGFSDKTGHFTQVVWLHADSIGCGQQKCGSGYYYSCNYNTGNVIGEFKQNVLPPTNGYN